MPENTHEVLTLVRKGAEQLKRPILVSFSRVRTLPGLGI